MSVFGKGGSDQTQKGGEGNTQNIGVDPELFAKELRRKDEDINRLIIEKDVLKDRVSDLEKRELEREIAELRDEKMRNEVKLNDPERAFREHKQRGTQIEALLQDQATQMALGENRVHSALEAFSDLEYDEIDALFAESEERGIMIAAQSAYGRGLVAEDAIKWHDAYTHYKRAANLHDDLAHLKAYARMTWRLAKGGEAIQVHERLVTLVGTTDGKDSVAYAAQLNNLADVVRAQGQFEEAEGLFREALNIGRATIDEGHPDYAIRLNNLAAVVQAQGRFEEARPLLEQALTILKATLPADHPNIAIVENHLASLPPAD